MSTKGKKLPSQLPFIFSDSSISPNEEAKPEPKPTGLFSNPADFPKDVVTLLVQHDQVIDFVLGKIGVTPQEFNEWAERKLRERDGGRQATDEELDRVNGEGA